MEAAGLLLVATAKCEGTLSNEQKSAIPDIFRGELLLSDSDASGLMVSSCYLLRDEDYISDQLPKILAPSLPSFNDEQSDSLHCLMERIAALGDQPNAEQRKLVKVTRDALRPVKATCSTW